MTDFFPKRQAVAAETEAEAPPAATADAEADARTGTNEDLRSHPEGSSSLPEQPQRAGTAPSPGGSLESPPPQQPPGASIPRSDASYVLAQFLGGAVEIDVDGGARETVAAPSSADAYHFSYKFPAPDAAPPAEPAVIDVDCKQTLGIDAFFEPPLCPPPPPPSLGLPSLLAAAANNARSNASSDTSPCSTSKMPSSSETWLPCARMPPPPPLLQSSSHVFSYLESQNVYTVTDFSSASGKQVYARPCLFCVCVLAR
jgi:hypothetical protein